MLQVLIAYALICLFVQFPTHIPSTHPIKHVLYRWNWNQTRVQPYWILVTIHLKFACVLDIQYCNIVMSYILQ